MQQTSVQKEKDLQKEKGGNYMFKLMKKRIKNEKGLTLIELLAVIVILAIVAAIAVPAIGNIINNSEIKATKADALNILNAANIYITDNPTVNTITYDATPASGATKFNPDNFKDSIQSLGSFENVDFTINKTGGKVTISTTDKFDAGGKKIQFNQASIEDIDADDADTDNTNKVTVTDS